MTFDVPYPEKAIRFRQLLAASRQTVLREALSEVLAVTDPALVAAQLDELAPEAARTSLVESGVPPALVFVVPEVLRRRPSLLGYYRLLMGTSQKAFYRSSTGLSRFRALEVRDHVPPALVASLPELCAALNGQLAQLVEQIAPVSMLDIEQLPLLTLGVQFDGGLRVGIGEMATQELFVLMRTLLEQHLEAETTSTLTLRNASGREVRIALSSDPDVSITEVFGADEQLNVAIEIKGGTDRSNAHNRAGEAEKSHQKVKGVARDFWTVIALKGMNLDHLRTESPTTNEWFDLTELLAREGESFDRFAARLSGAVGVHLDAEATE